jgi:hypothetical protein
MKKLRSGMSWQSLCVEYLYEKSNLNIEESEVEQEEVVWNFQFMS